MKILAIQESDWIERGPHQSHHLLERLSVQGHEIRVIDFALDWHKLKQLRPILSKREIINVSSKVLPKGSILVIRPWFIKIKGLDLFFIGFSQFFELLRQIKSFKPNIVLSFGIVSGFSSSIICKFYGIPFCEYWIDVLHELIPISLFKPLGLILEKITLQRCDLFLAINQRLLDYGKRFTPRRYALIRAGVDLDRFMENKWIRREKREQLGIKNSEIVLFYMGFLYNFSGLVEVIECFKRKTTKYARFKFVIAGEGDQSKQLKEIIKRHNLKDKVLMLGWQPYEEIPALISASDICLLPAHNNRIMQDIVPIKIYEYLALNKPVVATALPGLIKEFGTIGGVVYAKCPEKIMDKCYFLARNDLITKIGKQGREFIEKHCDWEKLTESFIEELNVVIRFKNE